MSRHESLAEPVLGAILRTSVSQYFNLQPQRAVPRPPAGRSFARSREGPRVATSSDDDPFSFTADKSLSCRDYSTLLVGNPFRASPRTAIRRSSIYVVNTACLTSISEVTLNRKRVRNRERWLEEESLSRKILRRVKVLPFSM